MSAVWLFSELLANSIEIKIDKTGGINFMW
jgi:hypothetical protein